MNILLTSAGKRNYLIGYFRAALRGSGIVVATDFDRDAPALQEADIGFIVPALSDPSYIRETVAICREHKIKMVIPLHDFELPVMSRAIEEFRSVGATVVTSSPAVIDMCLDKLTLAAVLQKAGLVFPKTYNALEGAKIALRNGDLQFPVVVKPRFGSGSIGMSIVRSIAELEVATEWCLRSIRATSLSLATQSEEGQSILFQEMIVGNEYGFDVINDLKGEYVTTLGRLKLGMAGGETERAQTVHKPELEKIGAQIGSALCHIGVLDCDAVCTPQGLVMLDINPRFGGGYPFSHEAGANIPAALISWVSGQSCSPSCFAYADGVISVKTHRLVTVMGTSRCKNLQVTKMLSDNMTDILVIWGAGGHGKVVLDIARSTGRFKRIVFMDDSGKTSLTFCDCPLIGGPEELRHFTGSTFIAALGDNRTRALCFDSALKNGLLPTTLVHTSAVVSPAARLGQGTVVMPGVIVNAGAVIGDNCIINSGAVVEHDCTIEANVHISPRVVLGGRVSVGPFAHIGIGAIVLPNATVGEESVVGAGAVVLREAPAHCTVVGVPAKLMIRGAR
jgi:carbamoyl-phosphate synthase large subunit